MILLERIAEGQRIRTRSRHYAITMEIVVDIVKKDSHNLLANRQYRRTGQLIRLVAV